MKITERKCYACRFWDHGEERPTDPMVSAYILHDCTRHAPIVLGRGADREPLTRWPYVYGSDSCGDFEHQAVPPVLEGM